MRAAEKITKARAGLILDQPFFGALSLKLRVVEDKTCQTAWTDGVSLGYRPEFIDNLSLEQCKGLIGHEVMHCACAHQARRGERDQKKWNIAADYAINGILTSAGFVLPDGGLINSAFDDKSADEIYNLVPDPEPDQGDGDGQGDGSPDPGGCGEVRDTPGQDGSGRAEQDWKISVTQAAQQAKICGKLPAGLDRLINDIVNPRVDWRVVLRQFIETAAKNDYTWSTPNRRFLNAGFYLPALQSDSLPGIVVAIDTSGSVSDDELQQFAGEISSILEEYDTNIDVLYCDTDIAGHQEFTRDDLPLCLQAKGGGGTSFVPPFAWIDNQGKEPACLIYLTDMCCSDYPAESPDYPVLWVATEGTDQAPPFGDLIEM